MPWTNQGLIFDCSQHLINGNEIFFAQSPQAICLHDRIRVFFTTRVRDTSSTWFSKPAYVDFSLAMNAVINEPKVISIEPAVLGAFDEHGIFPFHPFVNGDELWAYSTGWSRRSSVDVETSIGLLKSSDYGNSFERWGDGPVLTASLHEPFLVCDPWVICEENSFSMWYSFGTIWDDSIPEEAPQRIYKIGKATSDDAISWNPSGGRAVIPNVLGENEAQALPSVRHTGSRYEMLFCFRPHRGFREKGKLSYQLGFAFSKDGDDWTRVDSEVEFPRLEFDSEMRSYPSWLTVGDRNYILFNGNQFGRNGFGLAEWTE